jgi:hypothetical protein
MKGDKHEHTFDRNPWPQPVQGRLRGRRNPSGKEGVNVDPNATWRRLLDALRGNDYMEARAGARDLLDWLGKGGFLPRVTGDEADDRQIVQAVLNWLLREGGGP